jgi:hypothetical protein
MIRFEAAFGQLSNILSLNESFTSTPEVQSPFTTQPTQITIPPSLSHSFESSALLFPVNPQHWSVSTRSTASSKSDQSNSNESCRELSSKMFAFNFLQATFYTIEDELNQIPWRRLCKYHIVPEYVPACYVFQICVMLS